MRDESPGVERQDVRGQPVVRHTPRSHGGPHRHGTAPARSTGAEEEHTLLLEPPARVCQGGQNAGDHDGPRTLDVVVEAQDAIPMALEQPEGVAVGEVLPLDEGLREDGADGVHQLVEQRPVLVPAHALVAGAQVEGIVQQASIVRAHVEIDRQAARRVEPGADRVQRQLADGDRHATHPEVPQAEDGLVVGDDEHATLGRRRCFEDLPHAAAVPQRQVDTARAAEELAVLLADLPDGGRVDDRHHLVQVLGEKPVEERFVAVLHGTQEEVAVDVLLHLAVVRVGSGHLLLGCEDAGRYQARQPEAVALFQSETGALVQVGLVEQRFAAQVDFDEVFPRLRVGADLESRVAPLGRAHEALLRFSMAA